MHTTHTHIAAENRADTSKWQLVSALSICGHTHRDLSYPLSSSLVPSPLLPSPLMKSAVVGHRIHPPPPSPFTQYTGFLEGVTLCMYRSLGESSVCGVCWPTQRCVCPNLTVISMALSLTGPAGPMVACCQHGAGSCFAVSFYVFVVFTQLQGAHDVTGPLDCYFYKS